MRYIRNAHSVVNMQNILKIMLSYVVNMNHDLCISFQLKIRQQMADGGEKWQIFPPLTVHLPILARDRCRYRRRWSLQIFSLVGAVERIVLGRYLRMDTRLWPPV